MKKLIVLLAVLLLPLSAEAETIKSFVADITLNQDGSFDVSEIIVYDFGSEHRHGIMRYLPTEHFQPGDHWFKKRVIELEVLSVAQDGEPATYGISDNGGEIEIKIGDPEVLIAGEHLYTITYKVRGGLSYYDSGTVELYWDAVGHGWPVPIGSALARVNTPAEIAGAASRCYYGPAGSNNECEVMAGTSGNLFGNVALAPGEGLTVAQELDAAAVERQIIERWSVWPLWIFGSVLWLLALIWFSYRYFILNRTGHPIIPHYEPYGEFKPMYTGLLFDGNIDPRDITAGIVYLAEQGFFKIKRIGRTKLFFFETDDYQIELKRTYGEVKTDFQKQIFTLLFDEDAALNSTVILSKLAENTLKQKENYRIITELKAAAEADLVAQGFFEYKWQTPLKIMLGFLFGTALLLLITYAIGAEWAIPLVITLMTFVFTLIILLIVYRRRTRKGYEALDYLQGFKLFLSVTEKERFKFHNSPQKSPEQFMEYLPYAIAFGVENQWAEAFKDIALPEPDWYEGQGTAFNAVYLSQGLGSFGQSLTMAAAALPASSGGGSSGGGAGGGGGGSW